MGRISFLPSPFGEVQERRWQLCQWDDEANELSTPQDGKHLSLPHLVVVALELLGHMERKPSEKTTNVAEDEGITMGKFHEERCSSFHVKIGRTSCLL